jgi:hypothetical protein
VLCPLLQQTRFARSPTSSAVRPLVATQSLRQAGSKLSLQAAPSIDGVREGALRDIEPESIEKVSGYRSCAVGSDWSNPLRGRPARPHRVRARQRGLYGHRWCDEGTFHRVERVEGSPHHTTRDPSGRPACSTIGGSGLGVPKGVFRVADAGCWCPMGALGVHRLKGCPWGIVPVACGWVWLRARGAARPAGEARSAGKPARCPKAPRPTARPSVDQVERPKTRPCDTRNPPLAAARGAQLPAPPKRAQPARTRHITATTTNLTAGSRPKDPIAPGHRTCLNAPFRAVPAAPPPHIRQPPSDRHQRPSSGSVGAPG